MKRSWNTLKTRLQTDDIPSFIKAEKQASHFITRLREDLLINKGLWYMIGPYDNRGHTKVRKRVM